MKVSKQWLGIVGLGLLLAGAGCNKGLVTVKGVVTLDGNPVEGATVSFVPQGGDAQQAAAGITDSSGNFEATSIRPADGVRPGKYKVLVTKKELDPSLYEKVDTSDPRKAMENRGKASKAAGQPAKYLLPLRYSNPNTTPFTCTVPVSGKLELALTGGDKP